MTQIERLGITDGDRVIVEDDSGATAEYVVKSAPWQLGHGAWVIGLVGISGGYAIDRVRRVVYGDPSAEPRLRCALAHARERAAKGRV